MIYLIRVSTSQIKILPILILTLLIVAIPSAMINAKAEDKTYVWGFPGTARGNLNPFTAAGIDATITGLLFSTMLFFLAPNGSLIPWAASSWEFKSSGNYTEVYFRIRDNAFWSNGKPLTADDYIFTWKTLYLPFNRTLDPLGIWRYVVSVDKIDDKTIRFTLNRNNTMVFAGISTRIAVPADVWSSIVANMSESDFSRFVVKPGDPALSVTLGPFTLEYYDPQSLIILKANPRFFMGAPKIDYFRIRIYTSTQALIPAIIKGDIDSAYFSPTDVPTVLGVPGIKVEPMPWSNNIFYLWTNNQVYPTNLKEFRIALSLAINRSALAERAGAGYGIPRYNFIPPVAESAWLSEKANGTNTMYDPNKANEILDSLGFKKGGDGIRVTPNGTRLSFELNVPSISDWLTAAQLIASDLQKIGIEVNIRLVALSTYVDIRNRGAFTLFFGSRIYSLMMVFDPAAYLFYPVFHTKSTAPIGQPTPGTNWARVSDPNLDNLIDQAMQTDDPVIYKRAIDEIQEYLHETMPIIPLYSIYDIKVYRADRIEGIQTGLQTVDTLLSIRVISAETQTPQPTQTQTATQTVTATEVATQVQTQIVTVPQQAPQQGLGTDFIILTVIVVLVIVLGLLALLRMKR